MIIVVVVVFVIFINTRKPPCLSAVAAAMINIKRIPVTTPSQPLCAGLQGQASLLRACGE